jgi:hypothetical protein
LGNNHGNNPNDNTHDVGLDNNQNDDTHDVDLGNDHVNDQNNNPNDNTEAVGDTSNREDTTTITLETGIELVKRNRPLLDRLGKFGKVLENLLEIGTAVAEVNFPFSSKKYRSNHLIG